MAMLEIRNVHKAFRTEAKSGLHAGIFHRPGAQKPAGELQVLRGVDPVSYTHLVDGIADSSLLHRQNAQNCLPVLRSVSV